MPVSECIQVCLYFYRLIDVHEDWSKFDTHQCVYMECAYVIARMCACVTACIVNIFVNAKFSVCTYLSATCSCMLLCLVTMNAAVMNGCAVDVNEVCLLWVVFIRIFQ